MCDHCGCRSFGPIAALSAEHDTILELAWRLAEANRCGEAVDDDVQRELLTVLDHHVMQEERGLYPLLVEGGALVTATVRDLEVEHRSVHAALRTGRFGRRTYYALAAHIEQEEMELFPAAMFGFDDDEWDALDQLRRAADPAGVGARQSR